MALSKHTTAALHTLWQAAGGFAATEAIVTELANGDSHDAKLAIVTAGTAVIGAGLSLAKAGVLHWMAAHADSKAVKDAAQIEALAKAVLAYEAKHGATQPTSEASA